MIGRQERGAVAIFPCTVIGLDPCPVAGAGFEDRMGERLAPQWPASADHPLNPAV